MDGLFQRQLIVTEAANKTQGVKNIVEMKVKTDEWNGIRLELEANGIDYNTNDFDREEMNFYIVASPGQMPIISQLFADLWKV